MNASHTDSESRRARLARWLPAALCLGLAVTQIALTQLAGLSPWLGGGFGMFASLDSPMNRGLTITGLDENGDRVRIMATFSGEGAERGFGPGYWNDIMFSSATGPILRARSRK